MDLLSKCQKSSSLLQSLLVSSSPQHALPCQLLAWLVVVVEFVEFVGGVEAVVTFEIVVAWFEVMHFSREQGVTVWVLQLLQKTTMDTHFHPIVQFEELC